MVGGLNLPHACEAEPLDVMSCRLDRGLDSPDSGLPPSPSPSAWLQPACAEKAAGVSPVPEDEGRGSLVPVLPAGSFQKLQPVSFGEGIALDPLPATEIRYTSSVHYTSDRHFIQCVALQPRGHGLDRCRQTVLALPHSTWRHYKTQLDFLPRPRPQGFKSTTIVYPKKTRSECSTELSYDCHRLARRFLSRVELEVIGQKELLQ